MIIFILSMMAEDALPEKPKNRNIMIPPSSNPPHGENPEQGAFDYVFHDDEPAPPPLSSPEHFDDQYDEWSVAPSFEEGPDGLPEGFTEEVNAEELDKPLATVPFLHGPRETGGVERCVVSQGRRRGRGLVERGGRSEERT